MSPFSALDDASDPESFLCCLDEARTRRRGSSATVLSSGSLDGGTPTVCTRPRPGSAVHVEADANVNRPGQLVAGVPASTEAPPEASTDQ